MDLGKAMIVAGVGCRKGVSADEVEAAIEAALSNHRLAAHQLYAIAVPATRAVEAGVAAVAAARGVELVVVEQGALEDADARAVTRSERSKDALNVGSASEAAALAVAGPHARLLSPRLAVGSVTCALATMEDLP
jgi:cobalt-precorrin 5A hydrolase